MRCDVHFSMWKNRLGRAMARKLKVYKGSDHPHAAQKPEPLPSGARSKH